MVAKTSNEEIADSFIRHQTYLIRYSNGLSKEMISLLDETEKDLLAKIVKFLHDNPNGLNKPKAWNRLAELANYLKTIRSDSWDQITEKSIEQLQELALVDADFVKYAIESPLPVVLNTILPSAALLKSIVESRPFEGKLLKDHIAKLADEDVARIVNAVKVGMTQGESMQQMINRVIGSKSAKGSDGMTQMSRNQIDALIRTAVMHVSNHTHDEYIMANTDIIKQERFHATLDGRTTALCKANDGKIFDVGTGPRPPLHFRCFPGDTDILTVSRVSNVYKRAYKGSFVNIFTKSGRSLRVTPNHPILTRRGWVEAGKLNCFDQLACITNELLFVKYAKNNVKAKFVDLFSAINISANPSMVTNRPTTAKDFHGDFSNGEVGVINIDSLTWHNIVKLFKKSNDYASTARNTKMFRDSRCSNSVFISIKNSLFFFFSKLNNLYRFYRDIIFNKSSFNWIISSAEKLPYIFNSRSAFAEFDNISDLFTSEEDTHVFNLENDGNWYIANGVIAHNCRSLRTPVIDGEILGERPARTGTEAQFMREFAKANKLSGDEIPRGFKTKYREYRAQRMRETIGRVPAEQTYQQFAENQPMWFLEDTMGKTKAKLFREGKLTFDKFIAENGRELTITELRGRYPGAFKLAGIE